MHAAFLLQSASASRRAARTARCSAEIRATTPKRLRAPASAMCGPHRGTPERRAAPDVCASECARFADTGHWPWQPRRGPPSSAPQNPAEECRLVGACRRSVRCSCVNHVPADTSRVPPTEEAPQGPRCDAGGPIQHGEGTNLPEGCRKVPRHTCRKVTPALERHGPTNP